MTPKDVSRHLKVVSHPHLISSHLILILIPIFFFNFQVKAATYSSILNALYSFQQVANDALQLRKDWALLFKNFEVSNCNG